MQELFTATAQILGFAATAGVVSAALTHYLSGRKEKRTAHLANAYTAIRLAVIFEDFSGLCSGMIVDNERLVSEGKAKEAQMDLPSLAPLPPDDDGWRGLMPEAVAEALSFSLHIKWAQEIIQSGYQFVDDPTQPLDWPGLAEEAVDHAVILGTRAWRLAVGLRNKHGFKPLQPEFAFQSTFLDRFDEVTERRRSVGAQY